MMRKWQFLAGLGLAGLAGVGAWLSPKVFAQTGAPQMIQPAQAVKPSDPPGLPVIPMPSQPLGITTPPAPPAAAPIVATPSPAPAVAPTPVPATPPGLPSLPAQPVSVPMLPPASAGPVAVPTLPPPSTGPEPKEVRPLTPEVPEPVPQTPAPAPGPKTSPSTPMLPTPAAPVAVPAAPVATPAVPSLPTPSPNTPATPEPTVGKQTAPLTTKPDETSAPTNAATMSDATPVDRLTTNAVRDNHLQVLASEIRPGKQEPTVSVEFVAPTTARVNTPLPCAIHVRNNGQGTVHEVVVRHRLPKGTVLKKSEPVATQEGDVLTWNLGTMAPGQLSKVDLMLQSPTRGALNCQATVTFTGATAHQVVIQEPMLAVKMRGPDRVTAGENVTFLFALSNPGDGVAEHVKLKAILPDGIEHPRGKVIEQEIGNLNPKEVKTLQLVCTATGAGSVKASVAALGEGNLNANETVQVEILHPKLEIAMSGPKLRYQERRAVYVMKVSNPGTAPASSVVVQEMVPPGFKFHSASAGGKFDESNRTVSWTLGDIPPAQSKLVAVDLIPSQPGEHKLVARVVGQRGLKAESEVKTQVEAISALNLDVVDIEDPVEVGSETAYEIKLTNAGTRTENKVELICTLPDGVEFKGAKSNANLRYRIEGKEIVFETIPRLAPKADVIVRVLVRSTVAGDSRFRARVRSEAVQEFVTREETTRFYNDQITAR